MSDLSPGTLKPDPASSASRLRVLIESSLGKAALSGVGLQGLQPVLFLWKKLGFRGLLWVVLVVGIPVTDYSLLRYASYTALPRTVGAMGVEFKAADWSLRPLSLTAVARDVAVRAPGAPAPVFTAEEITFKGRLWTLIRGLPDLVTFHAFGGEQPFNRIVVTHGELHLERSLTGQLNWADFMNAVPPERWREAADGIYQIQAIDLSDFRISYVEHIPGQSGGGVIQTSQARVNIDQIEGTIVDLVRPETIDARPTKVNLAGRSADGTFRIQGTAALFPIRDGRADVDEAADGRVMRVASSPGTTTAGVPYFDLSLYLENIGAAAYGRMVPVTTIVPIDGSIDGTIRILRSASDLRCDGQLTMRNVRFGANARAFSDPAQVEVVERALANVNRSGAFRVCREAGGAASDAPEPPASILLARLNEEGTAAESEEVRALAVHDTRRVLGLPVEATADVLVRAVALTARGVGSGVRRLFGRGRPADAEPGATRAAAGP